MCTCIKRKLRVSKNETNILYSVFISSSITAVKHHVVSCNFNVENTDLFHLEIDQPLRSFRSYR